MRLIDADAIPYTMLYKENWIKGTGREEQAVWKSDIDKMPTIEPNCADGCIYGWGSDECEKCRFKCEPKRGRWEVVDYEEPRRYGCSRCKRLSWYTDNYCPNCGARMEVE